MESPEQKDHSHYSAEVQEALRIYKSCERAYWDLIYRRQKENDFLQSPIQQAWNKFVKLRKEETGTGFYLPKQQDK